MVCTQRSVGKGSACPVQIIKVCHSHSSLNQNFSQPVGKPTYSLGPDHEYIRGELQDMAEQLDMERRLVGEATCWTLFKEMWMIAGNRRRALISIGLMVCQQITGTNTLVRPQENKSHKTLRNVKFAGMFADPIFPKFTQNYYAPQIFSDMGLTERNTALFATGVYGLVKMLSSLSFLLFAADSLGRRKSLLISSVGMAVTLYVVGIYEKLYTGQKTGVSVLDSSPLPTTNGDPRVD